MHHGQQATATAFPTPPVLVALEEVDVCVKEVYNAMEQLFGSIEIVSKPTQPMPGAAPSNLKEVSVMVSQITDRINGVTKSLRDITTRLHFARERLEI